MNIDRDALRLLIGTRTEAEYRGALVAGRRGLRFPVARQGWRRRWRPVVEGIATLVLFPVVLAAFSALTVVLGAAADALP